MSEIGAGLRRRGPAFLMTRDGAGLCSTWFFLTRIPRRRERFAIGVMWSSAWFCECATRLVRRARCCTWIVCRAADRLPGVGRIGYRKRCERGDYQAA